MSYTLGDAAKATGKDRSTISRALSTGKISAKKNHHGQWSIDPSELHRVYPAVASQDVAQETNAPLRTTEHNTALQAKIEGLQAQLELLKDERDDLRRRLNDEARERSQLTAQLTDQRQEKQQRRRWQFWLP